MGNASSTNVAKIITDVHANVATAILQKQDVTLNNSQIIRIVGTTGDVNITNNTFRIKATVDMTALQTAMSDTSASSAIKNQLEQAAKTLTTGISLLQFTDARNTIDLFVKTGVELATTVAQTCSVAQNNIQEIELINTVGGNVTVAGNVFEQMASIYSNCAQNAVARNAVVQDIQNKVDQASSATVEGTSLTAIIGLGLAFLALPLVLPAVVATASLRPILRFIFPLMIVASVAVFAVYWSRVNYYMTSYGYASPIDSTCPGSRRQSGVASAAKSASQAEAACLADTQCSAYDFRAHTIDSTSATQPLEQPTTVFYSATTDDCETLASASLEAGNATDAQNLNAVGFKKSRRSALLLVTSVGLLGAGIVGMFLSNRQSETPAATPAAAPEAAK